MECSICHKKLRKIDDDWSKRHLHKKCWLEQTKLDEITEYLKIKGYLKTNIRII